MPMTEAHGAGPTGLERRNSTLKLWGGRFRRETAEEVEGFTSSLSFDRRLYRQDIRGSMAHARMLARQGIISREEGDLIVSGLEGILADLEAGRLVPGTEAGEGQGQSRAEDIHSLVEQLLVQRIGPAGGKLHTARSRNDQVALDLHLYIKEELEEVLGLITGLQKTLVARAEEQRETILPGYTHLQRAQPVLLAHHLLAYFFMLERDYGRLRDCLRRADLMPLGAAALAGTGFPVDPGQVARELGFTDLYDNSLDAVSDRDFLLEFLAAASICMTHLSRLAEELILWSTAEFGFVELDDAYATGSSIMPQKKNPDVLELIRAKTGRVYGDLMALLTVMKGLPMAYNRDLQEDKEAVFDAVDTLKASLALMAGVVSTVKFHRERMYEAAAGGFANATDVADYLARKGLPFRQAHEVVGKIVLYCLEHGKLLGDLTPEEFRGFSPLFDLDILDLLAPEAVVAARDSHGGTSPRRVREALQKARTMLEKKRE